MKIAVGCDHAGFPLKQTALDELTRLGHTYEDLGTFSTEAVDYPDFAQKVSEKILAGEADRGIILCGSGVGVTVAANKFKGIRACMCHDTFSARQGVEDDSMNVLCIGARIIGPLLAIDVLRAFLSAEFSGAERHQRRLNKILRFEDTFGK